MNPLYQSALDGTLKSESSGDVRTITFHNRLPITILMAWASSTGDLVSKGAIKPTGSAIVNDNRPGYAYVFTTEDSGAFVAAYLDAVNLPKDVLIDDKLLCHPNDVGTFPQPDRSKPIPTNSQPVLVGVGVRPLSEVTISITRHQYWRLAPESYVLAPHEQREVSYQESSGMQQTTSEQTTVAESLGLNAAAGWGPISVNISASLSKNTTRMQEVSVSKETVRYQSATLQNDLDHPVMYLYWQLADVVTVFRNLVPAASMVSAVRPVLVKTYNLDDLPPEATISPAENEVAPTFRIVEPADSGAGV